MKKILFTLIALIALTASAQDMDDIAPMDSSYSLLMNVFVQVEATQAINDMYNFRFDSSLRHFIYLKKKYGWHPLPYFLMGLNYWWRIIPDFKNEEFDDTFYAYMDTALVLSERMYEELNPIEGAFFLAATHAFKGRLHSERREYSKAAFASKNALKYLEECKGLGKENPELMFGDALFNYYAAWVPENYPFLKPIMLMFPKGDKAKGIAQLKEVARNAFYTRTEAQYYLMRIAYFEENDLETSLQVAEYLNETYPDNAYFHRFYARLLYQSNDYSKAQLVSKDILDKIASGATGYENNSGRYAAFFLGHINELQMKPEEAKKYFKMAIEFAEKAGAEEMGYNVYAVLHLGKLAMKEGDDQLAKEYFKQVKKLTKRKSSAGKQAKSYLKEM
ncbi:MAG: tol-pal system protein YbgF [Cyclobacteriaceae bacterium]